MLPQYSLSIRLLVYQANTHFEHGGAAAQNNVGVEPSADVDGAVLHDLVHRLRDRSHEVGVRELQGEQVCVIRIESRLEQRAFIFRLCRCSLGPLRPWRPPNDLRGHI